MPENVVDFPGTTTADLPPELVLKGALKQDLDCALVIGFKGEALVSFSSLGDVAANVHMASLFIHWMNTQILGE